MSSNDATANERSDIVGAPANVNQNEMIKLTLTNINLSKYIVTPANFSQFRGQIVGFARRNRIAPIDMKVYYLDADGDRILIENSEADFKIAMRSNISNFKIQSSPQI